MLKRSALTICCPRWTYWTFLSRLVAKSLVVVEETRSTRRYRMLETVRQYALERLTESGEAAPVRDRHLEHAVAFVELSARELYSERRVYWLATIELHFGNLRAALDWSIAQRMGDHVSRLANGLALYFDIRAMAAEGKRWFTDALAATEGEVSTLRAGTVLGSAFVELHNGDVCNAADLAAAALAMARTVGDLRTAAQALCMLGRIEVVARGHARDGRVLLEESAALARAVDDNLTLGIALMHITMSWLMQDELEAGRRACTAHHAVVRHVDDQGMWAWHWLWVARLALRRGELAEADTAAEQARVLNNSVGDAVCHAFVAQCIAEIQSWQGHPRAVGPALARMEIEHRVSARSRPAAGLVHLARGSVAMSLGQLDAAERAFDEGARIAHPWPAWMCLAGLADIAVQRGQLDRARALAADLRGRATSLENAWFTSTVDVLEARVARQLGDLDRARDLCHRALTAQRENGYRLDALITLEEIAWLGVRRGEYREAALILGAADAAHARLGARRRPLDLHRYRGDRLRLAQALGIGGLRNALRAGGALTLDEAIEYASRGRGARRRSGTGRSSLTPTEMIVVRLVNQGLTNPQIADRMLVSVATVKTHLVHIFSKLGVSHRIELADGGPHAAGSAAVIDPVAAGG